MGYNRNILEFFQGSYSIYSRMAVDPRLPLEFSVVMPTIWVWGSAPDFDFMLPLG